MAACSRTIGVGLRTIGEGLRLIGGGATCSVSRDWRWTCARITTVVLFLGQQLSVINGCVVLFFLYRKCNNLSVVLVVVAIATFPAFRATEVKSLVETILRMSSVSCVALPAMTTVLSSANSATSSPPPVTTTPSQGSWGAPASDQNGPLPQWTAAIHSNVDGALWRLRNIHSMFTFDLRDRGQQKEWPASMNNQWSVVFTECPQIERYVSSSEFHFLFLESQSQQSETTQLRIGKSKLLSPLLIPRMPFVVIDN